MKTCSTCLMTKDETEFHKNGDGRLRGQCKPCRIESKNNPKPRMGRSAIYSKVYKQLQPYPAPARAYNPKLVTGMGGGTPRL